jgi:hypothetical protein
MVDSSRGDSAREVWDEASGEVAEAPNEKSFVTGTK